MTIKEALTIRDAFFRRRGNYTEEEFFVYTEAMKFLISETADPDFMFDLGGVYYENKHYDLALKYYEMCVAYDENNIDALSGLGYIWYYGRTGKVDYAKAFEFYSRAAKQGSYIAGYKVADMYHKGCFVKRDYEKYKRIIEKLYLKLCGTSNIYDPLPEICVRLASIREKEGNASESVCLLRKGKSMLASRIEYDPFFGNFSIMSSLISDLYRLSEFDYHNFDLYDLYYLLKKSVKIGFDYNGKRCFVESVIEDDGSVSICFNNKWYHNFTDALINSKVDGQPITLNHRRIKNFKVVA